MLLIDAEVLLIAAKENRIGVKHTVASFMRSLRGERGEIVGKQGGERQEA
jgi:hypothetical protein